MEQRKLKRRELSVVPTPVDQLLANRYSQLLQWAGMVTRGDAGKAEEIVQELCLYFTLTQPDLTRVANLHGYLYTSLRHMYLSGLARSSREALHFVSVELFSRDALQRAQRALQNAYALDRLGNSPSAAVREEGWPAPGAGSAIEPTGRRRSLRRAEKP